MAFPIPDEALDDRLGWVGTAGAGKTYNAMSAEERILSLGGRVIHVDPLGVAWGLRLGADGATPSGFNVVIFGGAHGDLPLTPTSGAIIGETVAGMAESAIIDLTDLGTKAAERRFMLAFLTALYRRASGAPVHLVLDEADMWAPQQVRDKEGEAAKLLGMAETIVRRGRIKGFVPWLISQRPAVVNKDVLSQVEGLIALKLTASQDRKALGDWIEGQADRAEGKAILGSLPAMERGQGVVWIPGRGILETVQFPEKVTFDSSRTPARGEKRKQIELRPLDLGQLRERLATVEDEVKQNDPKALRAELGHARSEIAALKKAGAPPDEKQIAAAETRGYMQGKKDGAEAAYSEGYKTGYAQARSDAGKAAREAIMSMGVDQPATTPAMPAKLARSSDKPPATLGVPPTQRGVQVHDPRPQANGEATDLGAERKPLMALLSIHPASATDAQWATMAGFKRTGGTWSTYKSRLRKAGMITEAGDQITATELAVQMYGDSAPAMPPPGPELVGYWESKLPGAKKLLPELLDVFPGGLDREQLAISAGLEPSGGTFGTYLSRLRANGLIEESGGVIALSPNLMGA